MEFLEQYLIEKSRELENTKEVAMDRLRLKVIQNDFHSVIDTCIYLLELVSESETVNDALRKIKV